MCFWMDRQKKKNLLKLVSQMNDNIEANLDATGTLPHDTVVNTDDIYS